MKKLFFYLFTLAPSEVDECGGQDYLGLRPDLPLHNQGRHNYVSSIRGFSSIGLKII